MFTSEQKVKLAALDRVQSSFHKADVLERSGLDVAVVEGLMEQLHALAFEHGLRIEVISTPDAPHKDFRSSTLRVLKGNLCVHSSTRY